ncbi:hypothetical protein BZB76_4540 [Actinomadura pelletieri DSM 43383]|uniref:PE-PGRS family protein n=1 Tax=Actinomadura pelletieri DSM 43383 TaxID=1120940 RepID=A0A495QHW8_9ACTN|nr:DUF5954 family protein [Actinomadura pelletieri]RKS71733.1 hypothetical protein BZB76_4540 [Actinomadura pelletieri DSM 43383]
MTGSDGAALAGDLPHCLSGAATSARRAEVRARRTHPLVLWYGPTYGVMERVANGWMMSGMERMTPQDARDSLAWWFRNMARNPGTPDAHRPQYREGAAFLERGRPDELTVAGRVFRVVRADRFCRFGVDGPEQPRPTDPDDLPEPRTRRDARRFDHGLLPPAYAPGSPELLGERWETVPDGPLVPSEVTRDARRALVTHPGIARLAVRFTAAERENGTWPPHGPFLHSPASVRDHLATYFDTIVPMMLPSSPDVLAEYRHAADLLRDGTRRTEVTVLGRRFRVIRVEYVVRVGTDGPERPRPSDYDPEEPLTGEPEGAHDLIDDDW